MTGDAGFGRQRRLLRARDYSRVFADGQRLGDRYITILYRPRASGDTPRLGLAIAKKQLRRAVDRNRIKRLVRESFRLQRRELPAVDVVVMVRKPILELDSAQILSRLQGLWHKIIERCDNS